MGLFQSPFNLFFGITSQKKIDFRTGPSFSFGKGKGSRFKELGYLPEPDNW